MACMAMPRTWPTNGEIDQKGGGGDRTKRATKGFLRDFGHKDFARRIFFGGRSMMGSERHIFPRDLAWWLDTY